MYKTIYYNDKDFDGTTLIQALPKSVHAYLINEWTTTETKDITTRAGSKKTSKYSLHHVVLLVDENAIKVIRENYIKRLNIHQNLYPRFYEQPNKFFIRLSDQEKPIFDRVLKSFCKAVSISEPLIEENERGFAFVEFTTSDFLPQLLGLLRAYPELENTHIVYAKHRK